MTKLPFSWKAFFGVRDWKIVQTRSYPMVEFNWTEQCTIAEGSQRNVDHTLVLERCSLTGNERARMLRPPISVRPQTEEVDLVWAKLQLGIKDLS